MILLNPYEYVHTYPEERSRQIMQQTIEFFENKGKVKLKEDDRQRIWYADLVAFIKNEKTLYAMLTPVKYDEADCRWNT